MATRPKRNDEGEQPAFVPERDETCLEPTERQSFSVLPTFCSQVSLLLVPLLGC